MTTQARIAANRRNAAKSTGPRTKQGKAIVAQNAIKHGLRARQDLIAGEDPQEFALCRDRLLGDLAPVGHTETLLAERIVSLAWRLKRAERYQNQLFDYLLAKELQESLEGFDDMVSEEEVQEMTSDPETDPHLAIGRVLAGDYCNGKILDRLMLQERRIENSLYRTMKELRLARAGAGNAECGVRNAESGAREGFAAPETAGTNLVKQSQIPAEGQSVLSVETQYLASGPAETERQASTAERVPSTCQTKPTEAGGSVCSVPETVGAGFKPARTAFPETQNVASLQDAERVKQSQSVATVPSPCETKPTEAAGADCAKQSQPPTPAKGFVMVPRHARVAWHYHSPGR